MAKKQAQIFHFDLYGKREDKYDFLNENSINSIEWTELDPQEPDLTFKPIDSKLLNHYNLGFIPTELFKINVMGFQTHRDNFAIDFEKQNIKNRAIDLRNQNLSNEEIYNKYSLKDNRDWKLEKARKEIQTDKNWENKFINCAYRPFDDRPCYFSYVAMDYPRKELIQNFLNKENLLIGIGRQGLAVGDIEWCLTTVSKNPVDANMFRRGGVNLFPLYLYSENFGKEERTPNLNSKIIAEIEKGLGLKFVAETPPQPSPKGRAFSEGLAKPGYITANPINYVLIKEMRDSLKNNPTEAENVMWEYYRNKKTGHKIRRQHIIDNFITDFVCLSKKLVIEIDGKIHLQQKEYDELRTQRLNELGYEVIRFTNEEVFANPELVALKTKKALDERADIQNETNFPPLEGQGDFAPIDLLDYIYAVLHSPTYREKYKEFLKIDFPRVPYPKDKETFWKLVELGKQIREIHLLESPVVEQFITQYPESGNNKVTKPRFINSLPLEGCPQDGEVGNVYINETQYFANVPLRAWSFYIGGYQPAQKWLKDRKDRTLEFDDIMHYQKIIVALSETNRLMKEIDTIEIE